jgi:hypothetical protein
VVLGTLPGTPQSPAANPRPTESVVGRRIEQDFSLLGADRQWWGGGLRETSLWVSDAASHRRPVVALVGLVVRVVLCCKG